jgi:hypothetical protein
MQFVCLRGSSLLTAPLHGRIWAKNTYIEATDICWWVACTERKIHDRVRVAALSQAWSLAISRRRVGDKITRRRDHARRLPNQNARESQVCVHYGLNQQTISELLFFNKMILFFECIIASAAWTEAIVTIEYTHLKVRTLSAIF